MKIGIDARLWNETGVGRYIRALVTELSKYDHKNNYVLFFKKKEFDSYQPVNERWQKYLADIDWHSLKEQLVMPKTYEKAGIDLIHIPYFSVPILTKIPFVVTIHDLTISHYATGKATTKPKFIYLAKWLAYKIILQGAINRAKAIIAVSETVKKQLLAEYKVSVDKLYVTYESGELEQSSEQATLSIPKNFLLYVGNAHPHKNLEILLRSFKKLVKNYSELQLILVGPNDYFYEKLTHFAKKSDLLQNVHFLNGVTNASLQVLYKKALALVFPSQSEGFGIPGIEAMSQGTPIVVSDISVFHEIYGEAALYFNQNSVDSIVATISALLSSGQLRTKLIKLSQQKAREYSWQKMGKETLAIYENCARLRPRQ